jgi:hypothetical protein
MPTPSISTFVPVEEEDFVPVVTTRRSVTVWGVVKVLMRMGLR